MRCFYLFKINNEFSILSKDNPYKLYEMFESIYNLEHNEAFLGMKIYETLALPFENDDMNNYIFTKYQDNDFYTKSFNQHILNNYYTDEKTNLIINKTFIKIISNKLPSYFKELNNYKNIFVCDFKNKDYFWLKDLYN